MHACDVKFDMDIFSFNVICFNESWLFSEKKVPAIANDMSMNMIFNNQQGKFCSSAIEFLLDIQILTYEKFHVLYNLKKT